MANNLEQVNNLQEMEIGNGLNGDEREVGRHLSLSY